MDAIKCPYCDQDIDTTDWFENWIADGYTWKSDCPHCEKQLTVSVWFDVNYGIEEFEDGDD